MTYHIALLPTHIVSEILRTVVISTSFQEAQQLRLVNRLFNDEILFAIYVSLGQNQPQPPRRYPGELLGFVARRSVQGHLTKFPHDQWTANIREAIDTLQAFASSSETAFALYLHKIQCYHYLSHSSSASIFDDLVSKLICDALVAYYSPCRIFEALYEFNDRSQEFQSRKRNPTYSPSFLILLAACYSGDLSFVQEALKDDRIIEEKSSYYTLVSSCLPVVALQGHVHVMQYLLDAGFDVNHIGILRVSAILITSRRGFGSLLELLLRPEYGLERSGHEYKHALDAAADHHDATFRLSSVKTLYLAGEEWSQPYIRENLFFRACRRDDIALARWLLADGPVNVYNSVFAVPLRTRSILQWLAHQGKCEWVHWLLQVQPPQFFENDQQRRVLAAALWEAAYGNHVEIFFEIGKYFMHDPRRLCILAAAVEDGLPSLLNRLPSLDLPAALSQELTNHWLYEGTVGSAALRQAISKGRSSNVQMLLKRGVRTSGSARVKRDYYENNRTSFSIIETMLIKHANPMFVLQDIYQQVNNNDR